MRKSLQQNLLFRFTTVIFFCTAFITGTNKLIAQNIIITVAGNGGYGYSGDGGFADTAQLANPKSVCLDKQGNLYIADQSNNVIRKVAAGTGIITTIAGTGAQGYTGDGGLPDTATLNAPAAVFADDSGNIFIADWGNDVIREIVDSTGFIITVAGNGNPMFNGDSIPATAASLWGPSAVYVDKIGDIYIADTYNSRIRKVDTTGTISTIAGDSIQGYTGDGGLADTAELYNPYGITLDTGGNIYITCGNAIRKINAATGIINTIAGNNNNPGYSGDGGLAVNAQLNQPEGICLDDTGNLYIADYTNNVIRKVSIQNGFISTYAGRMDTSLLFGGDGGLADTAEMNGPTGVCFTPTGFLYLADNINNRIREVGPGLVQWTGVNQLAAPVTCRVFPNPSNGHFTLDVSNPNGPMVMLVYDLVGRQIYQSPIRGYSTGIDLGNQSPGIYFISLRCAGETATQKIVITK